MAEILNFTELEDSEVLEKLTILKDLVLKGESQRQERIERYSENTDIWLNKIWTKEDLAFFNDLDITPYEFPVQRPIVNNLISKQRNQPVSFEIIPTDLNAFVRHRKGRDEFVEQEMMKEGSSFTTPEEAQEFYDKYADDKYAQGASILLHNIRYETKAHRVDSSVFQQGLITGLDFWKAIYSTKYNRNGSIEITRRPQNAVFYDETSVEQDLSDVEFIGEVHKLYHNDLQILYPDKEEEVEKYFSQFTNKKSAAYSQADKDWEYFYQFNNSNPSDTHVKVAEIYTYEIEDRFKVFDNEENSERVVEFGIEEGQIIEGLKSLVLLELAEEARENIEIAQMLQEPDVENVIEEIVEDRFDIIPIKEPVWYKSVFTYNALLEHSRSELPHNSHPYYPYFAQFSEGEFRGVIDDIKDVIISINKALAFRELMMSHGAKNVLVVDEGVVTQSGYSLDEIAESWTSVGSLIALKLKSRQKITDVFKNINTVGDAMPAINALLADLDNRLYQISGVNLAQLGVVERQTTHAGFRAQVQQSETNNGLIYNNFYTSLEYFYNEKVVPLVVELMSTQPKHVIRRIGSEYEPWVEIELEEDFDLFADSIRNGSFNTIAVIKGDNKQIQEEWASKYMEMALAGLLDPEIAIEFSPNPDRFKILKRMKEKEIERAQRQAAQQFSFDEFYQIAADSGLPMQAIEELIDSMKRAKLKEQTASVSGAQIQRQQGGMGVMAAPNIRSGAAVTQQAINSAEDET